MFVTVSSDQMFASIRCLVEVGSLLCHLLALTVCKDDGSLSLSLLKFIYHSYCIFVCIVKVLARWKLDNLSIPL